ncbi:transposase [Niallia circulans]|nr:transposase [Niallia circulans]
MSKQLEDKRMQMEMVWIEKLVPEDHLVRKLDAAIDFDFIYDLVEDLYSKDKGRPSVDPVVLVKMVLIQYIFGIRSMRQTIKEIETNVAYRWFLGFGFEDKIPHFSTFGKNYARRFRESDVFERIFYRILKTAMDKGFVNPEVAFIDSTPIKANANKRKYRKKVVRAETRAYQNQLEEEINGERVKNGKKPLPPSKKDPTREVKESTTDPESGFYVKSEREKMFAYSFHTACDANGFVLGTIVKPANVHDSQVFHELFDQLKDKVCRPKVAAVDAGYKTPAIAKKLQEEGVHPVMPYKRPMTPKGYIRKNEFVYDEYYDCFLCPQNQVLSYRTTNREGYREYVSDPRICETCPLLAQCTKSQNHQKLVLRHIWQDALDEAEHLRHTERNRDIYAKRKETIERVFADLKQKHGLRWTNLKGLEKNAMQAMLVFAAMNLKKLATWSWRRNTPPTPKSPISIHLFIINKTPLRIIFSKAFCLRSEKSFSQSSFFFDQQPGDKCNLREKAN